MPQVPTPTTGKTLNQIIHDFNVKYPNIGEDVAQLLKDVSVPLKDTLNTAIQQSAPEVPLVRGWIVKEGITITDDTVDNFFNSLIVEVLQ